MVTIRAARWQMTRRGINWITCLWDVTNAFPSINRSALDKVIIEDVAEPDVLLLQSRHNQAPNIICEPGE